MSTNEILRPYADESAFTEDTALVRWISPEGERHAAMFPKRAKRLSPEAQEVYRDLQRLGIELQAINDQMDQLVPELRELGVSWGLIGFALGITDQGARQRWGVDR